MDTKLEKSKNPTTDEEITAKNRFKPESQNCNKPKVSSPLQLVRVNIFYVIRVNSITVIYICYTDLI